MPTYILQRSAFYGFWPEGKTISSESFHVTAGQPPKDIIARIFLRTYKNRFSYDSPANPASSDFWHGYPVLDKSTGFYVGETFFSQAKGDVVGQMRMEQPFEGEMDVFIETQTDIDAKELRLALAPYVSAFLLSLSLHTRDILVPKGEVLALEKSELGIKASFDIQSGGTVQRNTVKLSVLEGAAKKFLQSAKFVTREEVVQIGAAARRIFSARRESDFIDRFCDYWEACEFLCRDLPKGKHKGKDGKIAAKLADLWGEDEDFLWDTLVKPIYEIRNDVVHEYASDEERIRYPLVMMDEMASTLFAAKIGMTIPNSDSIKDYFNCVRKDTISPMHRNGRPEDF